MNPFNPVALVPILLVGAGRMGGALLDGWRGAGAFAAADVGILDPDPGEAAVRAAGQGVSLTPDVGAARTVVLAVKPQSWLQTADSLNASLRPDAVILSLVAGVRVADLARAFGGRPIARVMPTTAVAIGCGMASVFAADARALARASAVFAPVACVVALNDEGMMDAATAVSGSGPAYLYAFVEALEAAAVAAGLPPREAAVLSRTTNEGAAALLARSRSNPADLRRDVTSPGGTTEAALDILLGEGGLARLLRDAVGAAAHRSRAISRRAGQS